MTEDPHDESDALGETPADPGITSPSEPDALSVPAPAADRSVENRLQQCQMTLGYTFSDRKLLQQALTHASISHTRLASNERLEFLGDAIMGAIICEELYRQFPEYPEGELTRIKSTVVSRHTCAKVSNSLQFDRFVFVGKGLAIHDKIPSSILAALFEAIIAALYLDGGWEPTHRFVINALGPEISRVARMSHGQNFKSQLQQLTQKEIGDTPVYQLIDEKGPDHAKCFEVAAAIGSKLYPSAWGSSKKEAEQNAAAKALDVFENEAAAELGRPADIQKQNSGQQKSSPHRSGGC